MNVAFRVRVFMIAFRQRMCKPVMCLNLPTYLPTKSLTLVGQWNLSGQTASSRLAHPIILVNGFRETLNLVSLEIGSNTNLTSIFWDSDSEK